MRLPALVDLDQLIARIGDLGDDRPRAQAALEDASALVRAETGRSFVDDHGELLEVPDPIATVVLAVAARAWRNPEGLTGETTGPFTIQRSPTNPGVYLTAAEVRMMRLALGSPGVHSTSVRRPGLARAGRNTVFVPDATGDDPIPWETPL